MTTGSGGDRQGRAPASPLYVADTNVYIMAANDQPFRERLEAFVLAHGPLAVSAVVIAEVLLGIPDATRHRAVVRALAAGAVPTAPSARDWVRAGIAVAHLGGESVTKSRSFWNDALLAAQCGRLGAVLVTQNGADFRRLARHLPHQAVAPFP